MSNHNYDKALERLEQASTVGVGSPMEHTHLATAQILATLALVDAQAEATDWGKKQVLLARKEQTEFIAEVKRILAEED